MKMDIRHRGGNVIIRPVGALVGEEVNKFRTCFADAARESTRVVIDASKLLFVDSVGLESLSDAAEDMLRRGNRLGLACVNDTIGDVLDITELARLFRFYDTVEQFDSAQSD